MRNYRPQRTRDEAIDRNLDAIAAAVDDLQALPGSKGLIGAEATQVDTTKTLEDHSVIWFRGVLASTVTLPGAMSIGNNMARFVWVVNDSAVTLTIAVANGESLSGSASVTTTAKALFISDGAMKWARMF